MAKRKWTKEEIEEYRKTQSAFFYYNMNDSNFLVPKSYGIGRTINWGNPISWILILLFFGFIVIRELLK